MPRRLLVYNTPDEISDGLLWLKADSLALSDNDALSSWLDSFGTGNDATNSGAAGTKATFKTGILNGKPCVRFDGGDGLTVANESNFDISVYTIFIVATRSSGTGSVLGKSTTSFSDGRRRKLQFNFPSATTFRANAGSDVQTATLTVTSTSTPAIYTYRTASDTEHTFDYNGTSTDSSSTLAESSSNYNDAPLLIGSNFAIGTEGLNGDVFEIIIYNRRLGDIEIRAVQNYLANKYNLGNLILGGYPRNASTGRIYLRDFSTCLTFTSGQRVAVSSVPILSGSTNMTIAAWIKPTSASQGSSGGCIYGERHPSSGNDLLKISFSEGTNVNKLRFSFRDDAGTINNIVSTTLITDFSRWYHVAVVKEGTAVTLYINGVSAGTGVLTATDAFTQSGIVVQIGNDPRDGNSSFFGKIDDVTIYNTNLTLAQVVSLSKAFVATDNLRGWWKFDEGSGTSVIDSAGVSANGTITGATYATDKVFGIRTAISGGVAP